jgi:hypothetical protein
MEAELAFLLRVQFERIEANGKAPVGRFEPGRSRRGRRDRRGSIANLQLEPHDLLAEPSMGSTTQSEHQNPIARSLDAP